eukprot:scaffold199581_cov17-Prasinocladus_malaysianus.AAC.1
MARSWTDISSPSGLLPTANQEESKQRAVLRNSQRRRHDIIKTNRSIISNIAPFLTTAIVALSVSCNSNGIVKTTTKEGIAAPFALTKSTMGRDNDEEEKYEYMHSSTCIFTPLPCSATCACTSMTPGLTSAHNMISIGSV